MRIENIVSWKEFKITDLFNIQLAEGNIMANKCEEGRIPLISSGKNNNGICKMINENQESTMFKANTITVDMFGKAFYQPNDFWAVSHGRVNMLVPLSSNLNEYSGLFIVAVLDARLKNKYSFANMCNSKALKKETIKLPSANSEPDWQYMEEYIKYVHKGVNKKITKFYSISNKKSVINFEKWKDFKITELFDIVGSKTTKKIDLNLEEGGDYPYVTTAGTNNGVCGYSTLFTEEGNVITIDSAVLGTTFYQKQKFTASDHVEKLIPKGFEMNENIGLFISTILNSTGKLYGYAYNEKRSQTALKKEIIKLPVKDNGTPDWQYMDEYIERVKRSVANKITILNQCNKSEAN